MAGWVTAGSPRGHFISHHVSMADWVTAGSPRGRLRGTNWIGSKQVNAISNAAGSVGSIHF